MANAKFRKVSLSTNPTDEELGALRLGDVVYLTGTIYTGREGAYMKVVEEKCELPLALPKESAVNFHCSPAAARRADGSYEVGAVTATASFRFSKWLEDWFKISGAKLIVGKGGMNPADYKRYFVPNKAIYLTTVGYGTGALLGRGVTRVRDVYWLEELGIAQAMWVMDVKDFGPFLVESDMQGNSLFERENAKISKNIERVYEGTKPAILKRFGETADRDEELI